MLVVSEFEIVLDDATDEETDSEEVKMASELEALLMASGKSEEVEGYEGNVPGSML
jgi:hypothetical protein